MNLKGTTTSHDAQGITVKRLTLHLPSLISAVERADAADFPLDITEHVHFLRNYTIELIE